MGDGINTSPSMKFKYVAPASPPDLLECSSFTLDFPNRKFLHIGLDPTQQFTKVILIITPSRHIVFTVDFLQRIFRLMGNILSFLLNTPTYKKNIFLCTEAASLTNMVYKGENTLVMESKTQEGCRVLLNRSDLMRLLDLESSIMQLISRTEETSKIFDSVSPPPPPPCYSPISPSYSPISPGYSPMSPSSYSPLVHEEDGFDVCGPYDIKDFIRR